MNPCDQYGQITLMYINHNIFLLLQAIALLTDLNLIQIHLLPMCVIACQFNEKSFFTRLMADVSMAAHRSVHYNAENSLA